MKLVIEYDKGDFECYYTVVQCLEYESEEDFLIDFIKAREEKKNEIDKENEVREIYGKKVQDLYDRRNQKSKNRISQKEYEEEMEKLIAELHKNSVNYTFAVGELKFDFDNEVTGDSIRVSNLESWFENKRKENAQWLTS